MKLTMNEKGNDNSGKAPVLFDMVTAHIHPDVLKTPIGSQMQSICKEISSTFNLDLLYHDDGPQEVFIHAGFDDLLKAYQILSMMYSHLLEREADRQSGTLVAMEHSQHGNRKPTKVTENYETSRTAVHQEEESSVPVTRKLIKADLSLVISNSLEDEDEEDDQPLSPHTPDRKRTLTSPGGRMPWQRTALDLATQTAAFAPERRHSISVCESPTKGKVAPSLSVPQLHDQNVLISTSSSTKWQNPMECLSLKVEEVMHIRSVLTKAELECLFGTDTDLYNAVLKGKVCFTCRAVKFGVFGPWGTKCKFCKRKVCNKCCKKMRIPTEHFEHIPVYTLSPGSPTSKPEENSLESTGSLPPSPALPTKSRQYRNNNNEQDMKKSSLSRKFSRGKADTASKMQGPLMSICKDCKAMVYNVIKASRVSLAMPSVSGSVETRSPGQPVSRKPSRNFHLDLKPIYRYT